MKTQTHILKPSRLEGLTDGVFAIAMTLLVFNVHLPEDTPATDLLALLTTTVLIKLFIYAGSFIILGTLWIAINFQQGLLKKTNRPYLWANVFYLMLVCIVPFSANLVATYPDSSVSISFFAINLLCASLAQFIIAKSAHKHALIHAKYPLAVREAVIQRIYIAPICYSAALILAHWNTSIAFATLVMPPLIYLFPGRVDQYN